MEPNAHRRPSYAAHFDSSNLWQPQNELVFPLMSSSASLRPPLPPPMTVADVDQGDNALFRPFPSSAIEASSQGTNHPAVSSTTNNVNTTATTTTAAAASSTATAPTATATATSAATTSRLRKPRSKPKMNTRNTGSAGRPSFFWVNSDPQTVAKGSKDDTLKRIRSHVMAEHNRKKRLENTRRHKSKNTTSTTTATNANAANNWSNNLAFRPVETVAGFDNKCYQAHPSTELPLRKPSLDFSLSDTYDSSSLSASPPPAPPAQVPLHEDDQEDVVDVDNDALARRKIVGDGTATSAVNTAQVGAPVADRRSSFTVNCSPWVYTSRGSHDPFNTMHTKLTDRMLRHLRYFLHDMIVMACPLLSRNAKALQAHWISLVQRGPAPLHACICVSSSNAALLTGDLSETDPSKRWSNPLLVDTYHHRGETIRLVNDGLSDPVQAASDELIAAVSTLLTIEIASGNTDYLKIHLAGLRQMIAFRNSFADLPPMVRSQITWNDIRIACMGLSRPIFPLVRYTRPPIPVTAPNRDLTILASRLMAFAKIPGFFGDSLIRIMNDLLELTYYAETVKSDNNNNNNSNDDDNNSNSTLPTENDLADQVHEYFNNEILHVEHSLNADRYHTPTGLPKPDATIEGCTRLACLIFHNSAIWQFYPMIGAIFPKPVSALRSAVESTMLAGCYDGLCLDLLLWLLFIGACASSSPALARERAFFVAQLAGVVRAQGIGSWQDLRALLMGFFYVDRCYLVLLRRLWDEIRLVPVRV